ncbi:MAG: hypothetical protein KGI38_01435 [Thaumarchaeota archaeon]|nr:hypothetical protein [Nitrososphaerota archaeon]
MGGNQIQALAREVRGQSEVLERFARSKLPKAPRGSIFVGAGDSYAAALAGFYASGGRCIALDPYSLAATPEMAEGLEVFFISVSGRTASNIIAAKKAGRYAKRMTALTAVDDSQLARLTGRVVKLPLDYVPRTVGMSSFSSSLLAVLGIAGGRVDCDFQSAYKRAVKDWRMISYGKGTTYFLGNSLAYPAALYAAAKTYEILGFKAHAELLEEFSHLELFSLERADVVNILSCFDPSDISRKLKAVLSGQGYQCSKVPTSGASNADRLFHSVFVVQLSIIDRARKAGLGEPGFLGEVGRLRASDAMIY